MCFHAYTAERSAEVRFIEKLMPCEQNENEKAEVKRIFAIEVGDFPDL